MMNTTNLSARLAAVAALVPEGARLIDVGSDHALLPVCLVRQGKVASAIAADVAAGPLQSAARNIRRAQLQDCISVLLSNGFEAADQNSFDTAVIAGMGGDNIAAIIESAPYLKDPRYLLILQPQTARAQLRRYLFENGFDILLDTFAKERSRLYNILKVRYSGSRKAFSRGELYIHSSTDRSSPLFCEYCDKIIAGLERKIRGLEKSARKQEIEAALALKKYAEEQKNA